VTSMSSRRSSNWLSFIIHYIQSIRLPLVMSSYLPVPSIIRRNDDEDINRASHEGRIALFTGLDQVFLNGTLPASKAVKVCGLKPPQYLCYMLSGSMCDVIQLIIDLLIHLTIGVEDPSVCWALSFGLSIIARHSTHRYFVFGMYVGGYYNSLCRMYGGYSFSIVLSTFFNIIMTQTYHVPHYVAWVFTLLWTGVVNYFILKKLWAFDGASNSASSEKKTVA